MDDVRFDELEFTLGQCAICDRDVLTYSDPDGALDEGRWVHCDQLDKRHIRAATGEDLPAHGYGLLETQGCGNPSCGGGQCSRRQNDH